ncbi:MAG: EamA family transporter [Sphingomonadaceae bacterium]|nr:EamA family transporter [Sphingomonadaceae bacterium]
MTAESPGAGLSARDMLVLVAINILWGLNIVAVKFTVVDVPPFTSAALRMAMVCLLCLPAIRIVPGAMRDILIFGALMGAGFFALTNLSLTVADNVSALAIAGQLGTPFALILGVIFLGERIGRRRLAGIALALSGIAMLVFDPGLVSELLGLAITALASLVWAVGSIFQRQLKDVPVRTVYGWMGLLGMIGLSCLVLVFEPDSPGNLPDIPLAAWGWIAFSAIGSTLIGYGGMSWLLQRHPVSTVVPLLLPSPVIAVTASSLAFGVRLTPLMILGGIVAMIGVAIISIRSVRRPIPPEAT